MMYEKHSAPPQQQPYEMEFFPAVEPLHAGMSNAFCFAYGLFFVSGTSMV